ncbi:hypothetical protein VNO78_26793 [Psophocarpus tetragonolobus]|uniref:Uncharacterized protein n=1 Tax=Psophocarpus tetragonolobus TaxID=3891 RepID=A0AAN9RZS9_PSOTE
MGIPKFNFPFTLFYSTYCEFKFIPLLLLYFPLLRFSFVTTYLIYHSNALLQSGRIMSLILDLRDSDFNFQLPTSSSHG